MEIDSITSVSTGSASLTALKADIDALNTGKIATTVLDTDGTLAADSDLKIATQKAVKTYVDTEISGISVDTLWTDGSGSITPDNVTVGITCQLTDNGWWNVDRTVGATTGDQYGLGAGVIRATAGSNNLVGGVFHSHAQGTFTGSAWGVALEAWIGNHTTDGAASANIIGCESAVYGQYHANIGAALGFHAVFKNRPDGETDVLHGSAGTNKYNNLSEALRISGQGRSTSGEYCGWNKGIAFKSGALDRTTTEAVATLIDFNECTTDNTGGNPWIFRWTDDSGHGGQHGMRYNTTNHCIEFYKGLDTTPTLYGHIDSSSADHAL